MTDTAKEIAENIKLGAQARADAEAEGSGKIDKLLEAVGSLSTSMATMSERMDALEAKKDNSTETQDGKSDKDEEKTKADDDGDMARADSREASEALRSQLTNAQVRADSVFQALGLSARPPMNGETLRRYRHRLVAPLAQYSQSWKGVDLTKLPEDAFGVAEGVIYKDSMDFARSPQGAPDGGLREVVKIDASGRRISTFYGEPITWMQQFMGHRQKVEKFVKNPND